jgi:hypothetical protein
MKADVRKIRQKKDVKKDIHKSDFEKIIEKWNLEIRNRMKYLWHSDIEIEKEIIANINILQKIYKIK